MGNFCIETQKVRTLCLAGFLPGCAKRAIQHDLLYGFLFPRGGLKTSNEMCHEKTDLKVFVVVIPKVGLLLV